MRFSELSCGFADPRFAIPGTQSQFTPDHAFNPEHIKLELGVDINARSVSGTCTTTLTMLSESQELEFNAVRMKISSVRVNRKKAKYHYNGEKLTVRLSRRTKIGEEVEVAVSYRVEKPSLGVYFVGPDKLYPKKPVEVWTHSEPEEARYWYPCHDAPDVKATTETLVTVPEEFSAVSNGVLHAVYTTKGKRTFHWVMRQPHSTYLVMFAVGRWAEVEDSWRGVPVVYYCERGKEDDTKRAFGKTPKMLEFFSSKIGVAYPYERYAQVAVEDFIYGGMEHTTATTQTNIALQDETANKEVPDWSTDLAAHELAHQWFGDLLTCRDWSHAWLNESFATYFASLFIEHDEGRDMFHYDMYANAKSYFDEDTNKYRRPIVTNVYAEPQDLFDRHLYQKGACVLHMMRYVLGDEMWWKAVNSYVANNMHRPVESADLLTAVRNATGRNMKRFFEQWVFRAGHPEYRVIYYWDARKKEANVRVIQKQKTDDETLLFSIPIEIEFVTSRGKRKFTEKIENKEHKFVYKLASEPVMFLFDPDNWILKKAEVVRPRKMVYHELRNNPNVIGRISAANEVAGFGSDRDVAALEKAFFSEKFWPVQAEIAAALGTVRTDAAFAALLRMLAKSKHPRVKRSVIEALGEYRSDKAAEAVKNLVSAKGSYLIPAEAIHTLGKSRNEKNAALIEECLKRESWADVVRIGAINAAKHLRNDRAVEITRQQAVAGGTNRARAAAARNLGDIGKGRDDVLHLLLEMTEDAFSPVQIAAVQSLGDLGDERAITKLKKLAEGHRDGRVKRAAYESIKKIFTWLESDMTTSDLKKKLEDALKENEELRKKMSAK